MWGNRPRRTTYYSCQPSHQRSKDIPADHPAHVYLNEQRLNDVLFPFLVPALFGAERTDYRRTCIEVAAEPEAAAPEAAEPEAAEPEAAAPAAARAEEIEAEIADLERRLNRQLVNLEAVSDRGAHVGRRCPVARPAAADVRAQVRAEDCRVPPTGFEPVLPP
jgi:hypothetical protein